MAPDAAAIAAAPTPSSAADASDLSLTAASALVAAGAVSPTALTEAMLARIAAHDAALRSYVHVMAESARAEAAARERELAMGVRRGPLHGVPIAVKDLCMTHDAPTSAGMPIHRGFQSNHDATVVARLRRAGAVILGKLAMTEGAFAASHPDMPTPLNPWNPEIWSGASSHGSGAATAAGLCFGSLGSDTGGSIRFPSLACGVTGLKPSWGRVSRHGVFALADSLDHVGPMARSARDCAAMFAAIAGPDPADPTTGADPVDDYAAACDGPVRGLRIGLDREAAFAGAHPEVAAALEAALEAFEALGARVLPVSLPDAEGLFDAWSAICGIEAAIAHADTWPARAAEYGPNLAGVLEGAQGLTAMDLGRAMQRRLVYCGGWAQAVQDVDVVLMPVLADRTPDVAAFDRMLSGEAGPEAFAELLRLTAPADMTGLPALTLPGGFDSRGAPLGFQLIGRRMGEAALLRAGAAFQSVTDHHARRPDLAGLAA